MKASVADYKTLVYCMRIVAQNGTTIRFAQYPHDLVMDDGTTYNSDYGYEFTGLSAGNDGAPPLIDVEAILDAAGGGIDKASLATGVWDNARCYLFATSWKTPTVDEEPMGLFLFGKTRIKDDRYVAEFTHLIDALNQSTGRTITPTCGWVLFDEHIDGTTVPSRRSKCTLDIADYKVTGSVTSVTDNQNFADTSRTEVDDYFSKGQVLWTTGNNVGLQFNTIKAHDKISPGGSFELHDATYYDIQAGDEYEMIPGCRKRFEEDCIAKFGNGINNGGFPSVAPPSVYSDVGTK